MASTDSPLKRHLFYATSHSPSLVELVGFDRAKEIVDFCFIANPYYPTPAMIDELRAMLPALIKSYPSSQPEQSQRHLAEVIHVNPDNLIIGNGASELITIIQEHLIDSIAVPVPTFSEYLDKLRDRRSAELYYLRRDKSYALDPMAYLAWIRKKGLHAALIINPGNPSGQLLPLEQMREFLERAKDLDLIIVDESFIDFAGDPVPSLLPSADRHSNLLLIRSMSKHCGVPGLRLGYCYTDNLYLLNRLRRIIPTWNVNTLAEYFLSQLPQTDKAYHDARRRLIDDVRTLHRELDTIPALTAYPTGANFILVRIENGMTAGELQQELLHTHRMYVRDCSNKIGMDGYHVRIASQGREKDALLIDALRAILTR